MDLNTTWFLLYTVLIAGYAVLDGFDLGVGVLHLFARDDRERRLHMNAIGPVWDGNEVWLLTAGGALFAAFPMVYATVFSGFYLALMLVLLALIARAVSLEFRGKLDAPAWRRTWDWGFGLGSLLPALLFGVAVGNVLRGVPVDAGGDYVGGFLDLLNPYALLTGALSLAMFSLHGALWLGLKSEGRLKARMTRLAPRLWVTVVALHLAVAVATFFAAPARMDDVLARWPVWSCLLLLLAGLAAVPVALHPGRPGRAFLASGAAIAAAIGVAAASLFPVLLPSSLDPAHSLTAYNAASSPRTLRVMLIIVLTGVPVVIAYTAYAYRVFGGKTVVGDDGY